jgi:hypothetical protein
LSGRRGGDGFFGGKKADPARSFEIDSTFNFLVIG